MKTILTIKEIINQYSGNYIVYSKYKVSKNMYLNFAISNLEIDYYSICFEQHLQKHDCYYSNVKLVKRWVVEE